MFFRFFQGEDRTKFLGNKETQENECFLAKHFWGFVCSTQKDVFEVGEEDEDNWGTGVRRGNKPIVDL